MDDIRIFFNQNLLKMALVLGMLAALVIFGGQPTEPEVTRVTATEQVITARRTAGPEATTAPKDEGLIPTITPTSVPPTTTPTPAPVYYVVEAGDIPLSIASQYNIAVEILLDINGITDPTSLQIGQKLLIPVSATPVSNEPTRRPSPTAPPTPTVEPTYHVVQKGETLLAIALEFDTSVSLLQVVNDLSDPGALQIGQQLLIPEGQVDFGAPTVVHVIQAGDTFSYLSFYYGSTIDDILAANPGLDPTALKIGQKVIIPVTSRPENPKANPALPQIIKPEALAPNLMDLQTKLINAINQQRVANGLAAYIPDKELAMLALGHAQDMIARGYFAHTTPEGVTLDDRIVQHDVEVEWATENIQRNTKPKELTVEEAMRWWMSSSVHRGNILSRTYDHIGVGVAEGPSGWYTFVLVFAER